MVNPHLLSFRLAWKEYAAERPVYHESSPPPRKALIRAWRDHAWTLELIWRGVMQEYLPPTAWNALDVILQRRYDIRQIYLKEGGWLITTRGTRRRRLVKNQKPPNIRMLQKEMERAQKLLDSVLPRDEDQFLPIEAIILASSGAIYCFKNGSRRRTVRRFRNTWEKLVPARPWRLPVPRKVLQLPWGRRLR